MTHSDQLLLRTELQASQILFSQLRVFYRVDDKVLVGADALTNMATKHLK